MATITTTTNTTPFIYPSTTLMDMDNGTRYLYVLVRASTANVYEVWRSTNAGASWASFASVTRASVAEVGPINVPRDGYLYWMYRTNESSQDRIYLRRLNLATGTWGSELLVASASNGGSAGAVYQGMDFKSFQWGDGYQFVPIALATHVGGQPGVILTAVRVTKATGVMAVMSSLFSGTRLWTYTVTDRHHAPSLDYEHGGDNENGVPNLWLAFGPTDIRLVKLAWGANGWTGPTGSTRLVAGTTDDYVVGRWDGSRFIVARRSADTVFLLERNRANTATTTRGPSPVHPTGVIRNVTLNYNSVSGDVRVYAVGTSTAVLYYCDYVRASASWTSWGTVHATAVLGTTGDNFGARRSTWGNAKHDVYLALAGASPFTLTHQPQALSYAPNAPTWEYGTTATTPAGNGQASDINSTLTLDWLFTDPDDTDTQSAWALSRQIGSGTLAYFRASDSTWQATEQKNVGTTSSRVLAAGWGADADLPHTYKVKVWDVPDLASAYSTGMVVVPSAQVNPTITAPTAAQVITTDTVTTTWTVAEQIAYRVLLLSTSAVNANPYIEVDASNWTPAGCTAVRSTAQAHEGVASLLLTPDGVTATATVRSEMVPATEGAMHWAQAWVRCAVARNVAVNINWYDPASTFISSSFSTTSVAANTWTLLTVADDAPIGTGKGQVTAFMTGTPPAGNTLHVDEALFIDPTRAADDSGWVTGTQTSYVLPTRLPDLTGWVLAVQTRNAEGLASAVRSVNITVDYIEPPTPTLTATPLPTSGVIRAAVTNPAPTGGQPAFSTQELWRRQLLQPNVVANSDFDTLTGWTGLNASVALSSAQAHKGTTSALVTPSGSGVVARVEATVAAGLAIVVGDSVTVDAWVLPTTSSKPAAVQVTWRDGGGTFLSSDVVTMPAVAGLWQYLSVTAVAPASAATALAAAGVGNTPTAADICYVDELRLRRTDSSEGVRVVAGLGAAATYDDWRAVSGVPYEYRALVRGVNGASIYSPWTA